MSIQRLKFIVSANEQKTRRTWLVLAISLYLIYPLLESIGISVLGSINPSATYLIYKKAAAFIRGIIAFSLVYFFSYKKYDTYVLGTILIGSLLMYINQIREIVQAKEGVWDLLSLFPFTVLFIWYYILSFRLLLVNKEINRKLKILRT